jgi:hypothetical protein
MLMQAKFIGTWRLVSQDSLYHDGRSMPSRGENPAGMLIYDSAGNMAVQLMRTDEHTADYTDLASLDTALNGFLAYFGRYEVDAHQQVVKHHIEGASYAGWRGITQIREYEFLGDTLILRAASPVDNSMRVLVWRRAV